MCCDESRRNWSIILTLQDRYGDTHFSEVYKNEAVKNLKPKKWKPIHFMIYYDRANMISDLTTFAGRSIKRALSIDNNKKQSSDDVVPIILAVRRRSHDSFHVLWRLAYQWSLKHLHAALKELNSDDGYYEPIFKIILKSHTTRDIVNFCSYEIKRDVLKRMEYLKDTYGQDEKKLSKLISKIKKSKD